MSKNKDVQNVDSSAFSRTLYLASHNRHKQQELQALMHSLATTWSIRLAKELNEGVRWEETGSNFFENALIKATIVKALTTDCVLADDSGLIVDALGGDPGVFSSRYAIEGDDAANNVKLLHALAGVPLPKRTARFTCTLVFIDETGRVASFNGECHGHIAMAPRGTNGFGYDPLFIVAGHDQSLAELAPEVKNSLSHRSKAVSQWLTSLSP